MRTWVRFDAADPSPHYEQLESLLPSIVGPQLPEILFGRQWLTLMKLAIDERNGILTLEYVGE